MHLVENLVEKVLNDFDSCTREFGLRAAPVGARGCVKRWNEVVISV